METAVEAYLAERRVKTVRVLVVPGDPRKNGWTTDAQLLADLQAEVWDRGGGTKPRLELIDDVIIALAARDYLKVVPS